MTVQPHLAVICVTCGSRLKVLDRRLVGGISNCPKCGAMVQITPEAISSEQAGRGEPATDQRSPSPTDQPAARDRPHLAIGRESGIDSEALTQSSVASPQELDAAMVGERTDDHPSDLDGTGQAMLGSASLPADPAQVWQSESSRRVSQFGLVATLGLFGLIAATVAFVQFARSWGGPAEQASAAHSGEQRPAVPSNLAPPADASEAAASDSGDQTLPSDAPALPPGQADDNRPAASDSGSPGGPPDRAEPQEPAEPDVAVSVAESATGPADRDDWPDQGPPPLLSAPGLPQAEAPQSPPGFDELPPGLQRFVPLLNRSMDGNGPPQLFDMPPTIDSIQLDAAAGEEVDEDAAGKRPAVDVARALSMRFAIDHGGVTLSELMLLVSQLTGAAVEIELISLDLAGISTLDTLKTPAGWMSVQQWLDQSLAPAGMVAEIADQRVLVHATPQRIVQASGAALRLDDFGDSAEEVARWIRPVVGPLDQGPGEEDPEDPWTFIEEENRIDVPMERAGLIRTILAAESARRIRGLPGRLPHWQTARWSGPWLPTTAGRQDERNENAIASSTNQSSTDGITDWPLVTEGSTGAALDSPRTAAGLLRQLASENQVALIVAWRDAMRHQFYPADLAMPFSEGITAGALIDELIGESDLQARHAGNSVWWIGSKANYDRYEVITWVTIPEGSGQRTAARLAESLGVEDASLLPVAWDDTTLLVRAPRYIARQLSRFAQP